jgi:hypothetical protein
VFGTYIDLNKVRFCVAVDDIMERTHDSDMDEIPKYKSLNTISAWHLFEGCLRNYKALLMALQTEDLRLTYLTTSIVPELKDEFSRLRVWGEQTYVTLIRNARYSLDEQLCEDKNIKKIVLNSLRRLNNHIERGCATNHTILGVYH